MKPLNWGFFVSKTKDKRDWLNPSSSEDTGTISASWNIENYGSGTPWLDASLTIRDCSRQITLSFYANSSKGIKKRREKLDTIRKHLDYMEQGLDKLEKALKKAKKSKKK